jgi:EAL domain-containing protein (putative c-di-GMP-specific phosphodiesterase class I)
MQALQLAPDVIRLPAGTAEETIALLHHGRVTLLQSGIASVAQYESARAAAVELGEGALFGQPQAACRATHGGQGVAYNSQLSIGA